MKTSRVYQKLLPNITLVKSHPPQRTITLTSMKPL
jgi:hypothetical protein